MNKKEALEKQRLIIADLVIEVSMALADGNIWKYIYTYAVLECAKAQYGAISCQPETPPKEIGGVVCTVNEVNNIVIHN